MVDTDSSSQHAALAESLRRLRECIAVDKTVARLRNSADEMRLQLSESVVAVIPAFSTSANPDVLPDFHQHTQAETAELIRLVKNGRVGDFAFVKEHAARRAEQRFPLEASLQAYRCWQKVLLSWLRTTTKGTDRGNAAQIIQAADDFCVDYVDAASSYFAATYVDLSLTLASDATDQRAALMSILLRGYDESDGRVAKTLREAGFLDQRQAYCVAVARSVDPTEMLNPARAARLAESIDNALNEIGARCITDVHENKVTAVFGYTVRSSGWSAPRTKLADSIKRKLITLGPAVVIGISNDVPSTARIPGAYREAKVAIEIADVSHRVVQFSEIPAQRMLLHLAGEDFQRVLPPWTEALLAADDKSGGVLIDTLRAYADSDMNVQKTAEKLDVHANTVYSRMQKIADITHRDPRSYSPLTELLIVADSRRERG